MLKHATPFWIAVIGCVLLSLCVPGDAPWINDEPRLIINAYTANARGVLAQEGLLGSVGIRYGPVPTWIYQGMLLMTRNPVVLGSIKTAITLVILVAGLTFFSRRLGMWPWPILLVLLSPYVYFYNRLLWDNVWMIPVSMLLWCSVLRFWQHRSLVAFAATILAAVVLINIHIMAMLLILPLALTMLLFDRKWFREHPVAASLCILAACPAVVPYFLTASQNLSMVQTGRADLVHSLLAGLGGVDYFTFLNFAEYFLPEMNGGGFFLNPHLTRILGIFSAIAFIPFIVGTLFGLGTLLETYRSQRGWQAEDRLVMFALLTVATNTLFFAVTGKPHHPHYYNGVWFAYFFLTWYGLQKGLRKAPIWTGRLFAAGSSVMAVLLVMMIAFVHVNGGNRGIHHGPTLANQINVVKSIRHHSPQSRIYNAVPNYSYFPHALFTLMELFGPEAPDPSLPAKHIYLYHEPNSERGFIRLTISDRPVSRPF